MTAHRTGPRTLGGNFWLNLQQMKSLALSVVKTLHWRRQTEWDLSVRVDLAGLWLPVTLQEVTSTIIYICTNKISRFEQESMFHQVFPHHHRETLHHPKAVDSLSRE